MSHQPSKICARCKRELSISNFYFNRSQQTYDKYCKECRKQRSRQQRQSNRILFSDRKRLSINDINDKQKRIKYILRALEIVRLSVMRRSFQQKERELRYFNKKENL